MQNKAYRLLVEEPTYEVQYLVEEKNRNSPSMGQIVRSLLLDDVKLGVSSRALGRLDQDGQYNRVSDFRLVAVDVVADPSVPTAFVNGILESKQWILQDNGQFEPLFERFEKNISSLPKNNKNVYLKEQVIAFINALKTL